MTRLVIRDREELRRLLDEFRHGDEGFDAQIRLLDALVNADYSALVEVETAQSGWAGTL